MCVWAGAALPPVAAADPGQFPDLRGYAAVNAQDYRTYYAYSTTGVQFLAPGGYRCRMSYTTKASYLEAECWGVLLGTSHNAAKVALTADFRPGDFGDVDVAAMEKYQYLDGAGWHEGTVAPEAYKPLPAGKKVTQESWRSGPVAVCAADTAMTACVIEDAKSDQRHGFVLTAPDSWTF
ncbi:hypothetical protein BKN37_08615 [Mycobacterium talmoniae]|uniref:Uncharacterized protein n=1 Tax=Mycobacterium talmoniae TaxID=1858794 RepID=A0A1S1NL69_9MYCO|nr:hypothetical protein BKN37_08615 [Mycobacterium talmoniae]